MAQLCPHCNSHELLSEHEQYINCCYLCRRFGLLVGRWPNSSEAPSMVTRLTDEQIARVLFLTARISRISRQMPAPPPGFGSVAEVGIELAKALRSSLEQENDALLELGALLR